jgi:hypothetical protein
MSNGRSAGVVMAPPGRATPGLRRSSGAAVAQQGARPAGDRRRGLVSSVPSVERARRHGGRWHLRRGARARGPARGGDARTGRRADPRRHRCPPSDGRAGTRRCGRSAERPQPPRRSETPATQREQSKGWTGRHDIPCPRMPSRRREISRKSGLPSTACRRIMPEATSERIRRSPALEDRA